ncbi:hypothetical protein ElyMa_006157200 [Elysia marginata]|uniref:Uncharacterized protein n=1 Tax=Elysia marginata TaxID=1093978 RepID=A0AAV4H0P6_9GAST|nr:hypothetical protein ElyMa_006157200 [Elysia marginata]
MSSVSFTNDDSTQNKLGSMDSCKGGDSSHSNAERTFKDIGSFYREKYSVAARPEGLYQMLWCRMEKVLVYFWVFTQTLCLLVGLTVLHFTTFSAIICYLVNGVARGRRELLPHRYHSGN